MFIGVGMPIPDLANLPGVSRPGGGGPSGPTVGQIANQYSFEFDAASSSHYVIPSDTFVANNSGFSICFWYYKTAQQVGMIMSKSSSNFEIYTHTSGNALWTYFGAASANTNKIPVVLNSWQHICYVVSSTGYKGYQNGALAVENTFSSTPNYGNNSNTIYLAARNGDQQNSNISLEEIAFFYRELDEKDVKAIYDATTAGMTANLSTLSTGAPTAWYRMGD